MKKLHISSVSILFAALCLAFTACNQGITAEKETGTVHIVIGGGAARSVDAAGLPVFDDTNTKITVTGKDGTKLVEGTTSVTLKLDIGTKITVKAVVTTLTGEWRGSAEHTVTAGTNTVAVKLSKAPKSVGNILIDVNKDGNIANLKLASGASLVSNAVVNLVKPKRYPVTARDSIGRIYVLYEEPAMSYAVFHFKRFDVEGKEDAGFESAITGKLPSGVTLDKIKTMVIDAKTNTVFVVADAGTNLYAYAVTETTHNTFTWSGAFNLTSLPPITSLHGIEAMAAYNNRLFLVVETTRHNKLFAYKVVLSATAFSLEQEGSGIELNKLRSYTGCTGLFADADGVYCLLSDQNLYGGNLYALGQIVRYQYSGSAFTGETKIGLNPKAAGTDGIPFDAQYFSAPVGFIGYDEENLYIADDGVGIQYVNENYHVTANKNRIAAFNRKKNEITFTDTDATWYGQKPEYKYPNTKILLWERDPSGSGAFHYWTSADGTEAFTDANKLFDASSSEKPTDIFCYDQDGNLYILWTDNFNYKVRRFELKNGTSYATGVDSHALSTPSSPSYIAVDISGGQNYLYCGYKDSTNNWKVERMSWIGNFATLTTPHPIWSITVGNAPGEELTALAANKDGVFASVKETYQEVVSGVNNIDKYRLKVKKYKKADGSLDSQITLEDAVSYTDVTTGDPIADPNPGHDPDQACNQYQETINGLQIANGMLYGISSKLHRKWLMNVSHVWSPDVFKHSSILYKIGSTTEALPNRPLAKKERPVDDTNKVGYGFYRFIAVKYDEAERIRLIIASDSAWGKGGSGHSPDMANTDTIVEFNLKDMVFGEVKRSDNVFSKKLVVSGFDWN